MNQSMNMKEIIMNRKTLQHMIKRIYQLILVLLFAVSGVMAQTVQIHDVVEEPGVIPVPLDMMGFTNVGAITLNIEYDTDLLTFSGIENPAFPGIMANYNGISGQLTISYFNTTGGVNINGKLVDLKFSYPGGFSTPVEVVTAEIANANLAPIAATFIPGSVTQATTSNVVTLEDPGLVLVGGTANVPVTIEGPGFGAVNSITLKVAYDPAQLVYAGKIEDAITGVVASAGNGLLTLNWIGTAQDFTALTTLLELLFVYNGGGDADLEFYPGSEIAGNLSPIAVNYVNTVVSPLFGDPSLTLGTVDGTPGQLVTIPIDADQFAGFDVGAITLKIGYDPSKLTFAAYTPYQSITGWNVSASGGVLSIHRSNTGALSINDGLLLEIKFMYHGGGLAALAFNPGTIISDIFAATIPVEFVNGMVVPEDHDAKLIIGEVSGTTSFPVVVPISADGFDPAVEVGSITLKVGFPAGKLIFTGVSNPAFMGWTVNSTSSQVTLNWSNNNGVIIADGLLVELNFNYPGTGAAPVVFNPGVELYDTDLNLIPLSLINGGVNVAPTGFLVSGYLTYANPASTPLGNSNVYLKTSDGMTTLATAVTDVNGYFEFSNVADGDYMLDASTTIAWGGVDIDDAIDVYDFWDLGTPVLTGIFWLAADVNDDGAVDIDDAIDIYDAWNDGVKPVTWQAPDWVFENPVFTVSGGNVSMDIQGLCSGDVNADRF
jgi:hypothetical protein